MDNTRHEAGCLCRECCDLFYRAAAMQMPGHDVGCLCGECCDLQMAALELELGGGCKCDQGEPWECETHGRDE